MFSFLKPQSHAKLIESDKVDATYSKLRIKVFLGVFIGYAGYYLVRKNFSLIMPNLIEEGYTKSQLGLILSAVSIAYGISKFVMGNISDRSNPKVFLSIGLVFSSLIMFSLGVLPVFTSSVGIMFVMMFLNGWFQGMGWPACGRTMVHWFSPSERGTKMSVWNVAHNVGGGLIGPIAILGMAIFGQWQSTLYFPAVIAMVLAVGVFFLMEDTPQSCGLPPVEKWRNDYPENYSDDFEEEMSSKEIINKYILKNKYLWIIALANSFVYLIRYGVLDWAPTYLSEVKGFNTTESGWSYFLYEYAGIPGTLLAGWMSDKFFQGRRAPAAVLYMVLVVVFVVVYWKNPPGNPLVDNIALTAIGFLIYGPVMLIGVHALDLVPKKAAGTAAGLTGLFGYLGGAVFANLIMGHVVDSYGWDGGFYILIASGVLSIVLLSLTWNHGGSLKHEVVKEGK